MAASQGMGAASGWALRPRCACRGQSIENTDLRREAVTRRFALTLGGKQLMNIENKRSTRLIRRLSGRLAWDEVSTSNALTSFVTVLHPRLPRNVGIALMSWLPQTWSLMSLNERESPISFRGSLALKQRLLVAGLNEGDLGRFVRAAMDTLTEQCGRPLTDAIRRRIPELSELESDGGSERQPGPEPEAPARS